jgi:hypothetical protein
MIQYPSDFPAAARAAVEREIADAELNGRGSGMFVLAVFEQFVWELTEIVCQRPREWTAERLRSETEGFLDRLVAYAFRRFPPNSGPYRQEHLPFSGYIQYADVTDFRAVIYQELRRYPFWQRLQHNIVALGDAEGSRPAYPELAREIKVLCEECGWSLEELAHHTIIDGERLDRSTLMKIVGGTRRPHNRTLDALTKNATRPASSRRTSRIT